MSSICGLNRIGRIRIDLKFHFYNKLIVIVILTFFFGCEKNDQFILNGAKYQMWKEYIQPTEEELKWTCIPWKSSFREGLIDADREQKPLLLWVMNGHPLGCT